MGIRKTILSRIAIVYFVLFLFGVVVVFKMISVQQINNDRWQQIEKNLSKNTVLIPPVRGTICASDGSVLATSVPGYKVRIDLAAEGVKKVFEKESDSLAYYLSAFYKDASKNEYKRKLRSAYNAGNRGFLLTPTKIDYTELQKFKKFPILRHGHFGGGMIIEQENKRLNPLGILAARTIGGMNKAGALTPVPIGHNGLERAYEMYLRGENGISYKQNIAGRWITRTEIEPQNGMDIITTIDVKMQDIAESALFDQIVKSNAEWATAVLMEVKTGEIKAIANLGKTSDGFAEKDNYALGYRGCYEPGSTFKLVSLMVALEDGVVDTSDVFDTGNGYWATEKIYDDHACGKINVKQILEQSSNIGTAKVILENYRNKPRDYVDRVYSFGIHKPLGLELNGEGQPYIKYPGNADWWGTTLGRMSYGYDLRLTPLQVLNFYNAVANGGKMVKPQLVREIRKNGALIRSYKTEYINPMIASKETISKAQAMLKGVCQNGTGRAVQGEHFKVAGKTGTARVAREDGAGYVQGAYYASFVGYFPADDPMFSLIVTFKRPRNSIYGAAVAGPVFKEISEKVFAGQVMDGGIKEEKKENESTPLIKPGEADQILKIAQELQLQNVEGKPGSKMATVSIVENKVVLTEKEISAGTVPDVRGMGASNAIYLMENAGLKVKIKGVGKVSQQSLQPGSKYRTGQTVYLALK
ncbi:penicillin-binding transpeptidase domain-containing protein [Prolixibacteraceae bacterium Z1-6]|uniref:Penicillin-binding transpeptidase domain-containing protein n=1 Tax=Draconibacterium aestuarii TaxID=2998507 RepID=A0A9X3J6Z7_9BACT|nr:penicillin-binding transpeptidase domain-containing protein [Prolixibacteraceae bacterium Z1-6]